MDAYIDDKKEKYTHKDEWEKRIINVGEFVTKDYVVTFSERDSTVMRAALINEYRDWLLGGKNYDWKYEVNKLNGDIILWRR